MTTGEKLASVSQSPSGSTALEHLASATVGFTPGHPFVAGVPIETLGVTVMVASDAVESIIETLGVTVMIASDAVESIKIKASEV
jgi:hypothetical protein